MANWSSTILRQSFLLSIIFLATTANSLPLPVSEHPPQLWGFFGHKRINRIACFTLPPKLFGFFKDHIEYITDHAVDPDKRRYAVEGEEQRHYIDIDHYAVNGEDPFQIVPKKWQDAVDKFTEDPAGIRHRPVAYFLDETEATESFRKQKCGPHPEKCC